MAETQFFTDCAALPWHNVRLCCSPMLGVGPGTEEKHGKQALRRKFLKGGFSVPLLMNIYLRIGGWWHSPVFGDCFEWERTRVVGRSPLVVPEKLGLGWLLVQITVQ